MAERTEAMLKIVLAFSKAREYCEVGLCVNASYLNCARNQRIFVSVVSVYAKTFFLHFSCEHMACIDRAFENEWREP